MVTARVTFTGAVTFCTMFTPPTRIHTELIITVADTIFACSLIITCLCAADTMDAFIGAFAYATVHGGLHSSTYCVTSITDPTCCTIFTSWYFHCGIADTSRIAIIGAVR